MLRRSRVPPCLFLMLCLSRPVLYRFLLVSSVLFPGCLKRADLFSSGLFVFIQLDLVHDRLKRADLCSSGLRFFVQLDLVRDRLDGGYLYSSGFLFPVQLDLVRRWTEARRSTRLTLNYKLVSKCSSMITSLLLHGGRFLCDVCCTLTGLNT